MLVAAMLFTSVMPAYAEDSSVDSATESSVVSTIEDENEDVRDTAESKEPEDRALKPDESEIPQQEETADKESEQMQEAAEDPEAVSPEGDSAGEVSNEKEETANGQFAIMSTTDVHGKVWDENILNDTSVNNSLLNVSTAVDEYRAAYGEENVILLDNGDLYQGTPISSYNISQYTQGETTDINPMAKALAYIGYDASILGNHEFNYPWSTMSDIYKYLEENGVGIVCANLYYKDSDKRVFDPYMLKTVEVAGQEITIGIIGLENTDCTRWDVEDNYPGMIFAAPENTSMDLAYEVQKVQNEWETEGIDPDFVLVCYHGALGTESDTLTFGVNTENQVLHIIQNTSGIDMVISGHDHSTSYSNNMYTNKSGEEVLVVNGGGTELTASVWNVKADEETGKAEVSLDRVESEDLDGEDSDEANTEGTVEKNENEATPTAEDESAETADISLDSSKNLTLSQYAVDSSLKAVIEPYVAAAKDYVNTSVGNLLNWDGKTNSNNAYYLTQTDTADLINRSQISEGSKYLNEKYNSIEEVNAKLREIYGEDTYKQLDASALVNGQLVVDASSTSIVTSSPLPAAGDSELTMKGIYGFYKYDNSLYLLTLTGSEIKDLLEYNASDRIVVKFKDGEAVFTDTGDYNANFTFPVFYGLNYEIDMAREEGSRVNIEGFSNGKNFSEDEVYVFAINNYHLGNTYNAVMGQYTTADAIWSQTDDLGGGYVQDLVADYVSAMTEEYGGVYGSAEADKNGEGICRWGITYSAEIPTGTVISDNTAYVGERTDTLNDGDQIMIYNVGNEYAVSSEYYNQSTPTLNAAAGTAKDRALYAESGAAIFTVGVTEEGYYTFRTDEGYLTSAANGSGLGYQEELNQYGLWELVDTDDGNVFYIKNVNAKYNGTSVQYLEYYYGKFTTYGMTSATENYGVSFYKVKTAGAEVSADGIQDGDSLLIYYNNGETVLGPASGNKLSAVGASLVSKESGSTLVVPEEGAAVFTVGITEDGKYTFSTEDGYLTSGQTGNSLGFSAELSDLGCWELEETSDGYYFIHNVGANYNGNHNQYLEYYNGFTTYGMSSSKPELYTFTLYKVGAVSADEEEIIEGYTLPVFETSDVHGYLLDTSSGSEETYQYRLAYIADKVNDAREAYGEENVILLDGGDIYQGNVISNLQDGEPMTAAYDLMEYDAVSIGNHEFDWGYETVIDEDGTMSSYSVGEYEGDSQIPVVTSNLYQDGEKAAFANDYVILEKTATDEEGNKIEVRIGVIGFVDDYAADIMAAQFTGRGFTVDEDYDALEDLAYYLEEEEECDATIALCHADAAAVAGKLGGDSVIDLVCGGHSHSAQSGVGGSGAVYVQPSNQGASYGYAELVFQTEEGSEEISGVRAVEQQTVSVTGDKTKLYDTEENAEDLDGDIVALAKASVENVSDVLETTLGYITTDVTKAAIGDNSFSSTAGNWMTSMMARSVDADVAFTNNGGIRTEFLLDEEAEYRYITAGDIYTISPFCNIIYSYEVTYAELLEILQYALGSGSALGLRMSGIDCYYSNGVVTDLILADGTQIYSGGIWLDGYDTKTLKVATNEYVATSDTPFKAWNDTDKLISNSVVDNEGAIQALREEAAETGGYLYVDPNPHMINGTYEASEHEHSYIELTFEPSCTEEGYTIRICEDCGEYSIIARTEKLAHHYQDGVCTVCGEKDPEYNSGGTDDETGGGTDDGTGGETSGGTGDSRDDENGSTSGGNTGKQIVTAVKTGDSGSYLLYVVLLVVCAGAAGYLAVRMTRKKKH